ncbi:restriction endonuclease subunit S [Crocinitomix algicola]|uniref:restriction endonuclease subunit S n=1 Tax=Crocinitomix algicola TaxID=1740263 RepID=UPI000873104F|nr:restriction endonuclease subunit S [Crocinitomix algicola]
MKLINKISFPDDWKPVKLKNIGDIFKGKGISKSEIQSEGLPCVRYGEIYTEYQDWFSDTVSFISKDSALKSMQIKMGDVLFAGSGETPEDIGRAIAYVSNNEAYAGGDIVIFRPEYNECGQFLGYLLNSDYVNQQKFQFAQGHSVVHLYGKNIEELEVVLPPLPEQKKIAAILSKWDELIETQTQLIAAKEQQKKGLMQKLLTGELRFPGFEGEWEELELNDIFNKIIGGGTPSRQNPLFWNGDIFWCTVKDFTNFNPNQTQETITEQGLKSSASNLVQKGTLIIPTRMAIGKIAIFNVDVAINQDLKALFLNDKAKNEFLYQWFNFYSESISNLGTGSTVKGIKLEELKTIEISLPPIKEQEKIANTLIACDLEIQSLKDELEAIKLQKKGLMQQLLTGKIRVKV